MRFQFLIGALVMLMLQVSSAFTQITITSDDIEYLDGDYNKMYGRNTLYIVQGLTGKIGGPHTWDFSGGPTDIDYTFDYVLPSTTPCSADFPLSTIAEKRTGDGSEAYLFLDFPAGTGRVNYGACQPGVLTIPYVFNPPIVDFPETINYIDSWSGTTYFPAQSGGIDVDVEYSFISFCNAYGTLTLPDGLGEFPCLQVNNLEHYKFYWMGYLVGESYIRSFYWLIEDGGLAVIITSEEGTSAPPEDFAYSSGYNRMYESSKLSGSDEFQLVVTAMLEGPFNSASELMNTSLNPNHIPLNQPFNNPPWDYNGTESVVSIPDPDIVDWLLVELRDTTMAYLATPATTIAKQAVFVKNDGSIVGMNGIDLPVFDVPVNNNLFLVLIHKNHLDVMSAIPLVNISGIYAYNFTNAPDKAYGGLTAQNQVAGSVWAMISGDANADGDITTDDISNVWITEAGLMGYNNSDNNQDSQVDNQDKNDHWLPNLGKGSFIPE